MKTNPNDQLPPFRTAKPLRLHMPLLLAACVLGVTSAAARTAPKYPTPSLNGKKRSRAAELKSPVSTLELSAAAPPSPASPLPPEEMPPQVPQVYWDGKQLTITSDNSTLADILTAIRTLTGAELDIPPTASRERVAARLGPGPAREVLSTLLSWTDFNYVIQASDINPDGIRSVLLTPRGKSEFAAAKSAPGVLAESPARSSYRSYTRSSPVTEEVPAPENTASTQPESLAEPPLPSSQLGDSAPQPAAAVAQPALTEVPAVAAGVQPAQPDPTPSDASSNSGASQAPASESEQRIQQMQDMFQQRKQMMEDARKPPPNSP